MGDDFEVKAAAGSLRGTVRPDATLPHRWTAEGVALELQFTGAHLLHLAAAGCVLNDVFREAVQTGIEVRGVLVTDSGDFDVDSWRSGGIVYRVDIDSPASHEDIGRLLLQVDAVAEIPKALRAGAAVKRAE